MEPFDYPDNDPGPQTLLTSLDAGQNIDRLHWLMSRFQGYVGIANYMGGRFSASEQALGPVLREAAKRGLIYFDDSSSARSLASQIAGANSLAFAKADVVIDAVPTPADVDRALARLETAARAKGRRGRRSPAHCRCRSTVSRAGQGCGKPRHRAGADHGGGGDGEVELKAAATEMSSSAKVDDPAISALDGVAKFLIIR